MASFKGKHQGKSRTAAPLLSKPGKERNQPDSIIGRGSGRLPRAVYTRAVLEASVCMRQTLRAQFHRWKLEAHQLINPFQNRNRVFERMKGGFSCGRSHLSVCFRPAPIPKLLSQIEAPVFEMECSQTEKVHAANSRLQTRTVCCADSSSPSRSSTPASVMRTVDAHAGHCSAQFPTQLQSWQRYAEESGMYCIEARVIG